MSELHYNSIEFSTFEEAARKVLEAPNDLVFERSDLIPAVEWPRHMERALNAMKCDQAGPRPRSAWTEYLFEEMRKQGARVSQGEP
jgi:hypothetical protein